MSLKSSILAFLFLSVIAKSEAQQIDSLIVKEIKSELEHMYDSDQAQRSQISSLSKQLGSDSEEVRELWRKQSHADKRNVNRLHQVIEAHGWPKRSIYGKKASSAAFLIVQHADLEVQKKYLPLVEAAFEENELDGESLALLHDRILMREGKKQIYGSQLTQNRETGELELHPIEDEANVDKRRAHMGMISLSEYLKLFDLEYEPPGN